MANRFRVEKTLGKITNDFDSSVYLFSFVFLFLVLLFWAALCEKNPLNKTKIKFLQICQKGNLEAVTLIHTRTTVFLI
jgi:hypothetical protein